MMSRLQILLSKSTCTNTTRGTRGARSATTTVGRPGGGRPSPGRGVADNKHLNRDRSMTSLHADCPYRLTDSPTNPRNLVETGSHFRMANSPSLAVPIPTRIARTKTFVWASHVRPTPTSIAHTIAKWEPYRPNFVDARD